MTAKRKPEYAAPRDAEPRREPAELHCVIDSPRACLVRGQRFEVFGWAASSVPIVSIQAIVDEQTVGPTQFGIPRPDVISAHHHLPRASAAGFRSDGLMTPSAAGPTLSLGVNIALVDGRVSVFRRHVYIADDAAGVLRACREAQQSSAAILLDAVRGFLARPDYDQAECLAAVACARFPELPDAHCAYAEVARVAAQAGQATWEEASQRWEVARQKHPDYWPAVAGAARALLQLRQFDQAQSLLTDAMAAWPAIAELAAAHGELPLIKAAAAPIHERRPLFIEAQIRWAKFREHHPQHAMGYIFGAHALALSNEMTEADQLISAAVQQFPSSEQVASGYVKIPIMQGDWPAALDRVTRARRQFPDFPYLKIQEELIRNETLAAGGAKLSAPALKRLESDIDGSDRDLMFRFEALGHNCDFGAVQRHFGAEPLGLLRFASVPFAKLLEALDARFAGVGDPANTVFDLRRDPQPEYWVSDKRFEFTMHTFIYPEAVPDEPARCTLRDKHAARLAYLAARLIADLEEGDKIFVHQLPRCFVRADMQTLFTAIRQYGNNTLLCVGAPDADQAAGSVEVIEPGLLAGFLTRFNTPGTTGQVDFKAWNQICRRAARLRLETDGVK